jgi:hypothetical protein
MMQSEQLTHIRQQYQAEYIRNSAITHPKVLSKKVVSLACSRMNIRAHPRLSAGHDPVVIGKR